MNISVILENKFEIYLDTKNNLRVLKSGVPSDYTALPTETRQIFRDEMNKDHSVIVKLRQMGYILPEEMELKFVACRYGAINEKPDLVGNKTYPDAPACDFINHCPGCGKVCLLPDHLSPKEFQVVKLTALGKLDKEISTALNITKATCRTYFARIHEKLQVNNRIEIALRAHRLGIL